MDAQAIVSLFAVFLGTLFLTLRNNADKDKEKKKYIRRANGHADHYDDDTVVPLRQTVDAMVTTANLSERLLTRMEQQEKAQAAFQETTQQELEDMRKKISQLEIEGKEKDETIEKQASEIVDLQAQLAGIRVYIEQKYGDKISTQDLKKLAADLTKPIPNLETPDDHPSDTNTNADNSNGEHAA